MLTRAVHRVGVRAVSVSIVTALASLLVALLALVMVLWMWRVIDDLVERLIEKSAYVLCLGMLSILRVVVNYFRKHRHRMSKKNQAAVSEMEIELSEIEDLVKSPS